MDLGLAHLLYALVALAAAVVYYGHVAGVFLPWLARRWRPDPDARTRALCHRYERGEAEEREDEIARQLAERLD